MIFGIHNNIFFISFSVPFNIFEAQKTRNTLAKLVYTNLFKFIELLVNRKLKLSSELSESLDSKTYVNILDIAGFGMFIL